MMSGVKGSNKQAERKKFGRLRSSKAIIQAVIEVSKKAEDL